MNEEFMDSLVRHQMFLHRYSVGVANRVNAVLDASEQDIADKIVARLADRKPGLGTPTAVRRLKSLQRTIGTIRRRAWRDLNKEWVGELTDLVKSEPEFAASAAQKVSPALLNLALPSSHTLAALVNEKPFEGRVLKDWAAKMEADDLARIQTAVANGMVQGEGARDIARRVVGSQALNGADGVTATTRRHAMAVTRTAVNFYSNAARREMFRENTDVIEEELFVATLDNRTTLICAGLDGQRFKVAEGPIPPMHWMCRSTRTAIFNGKAIGDRPAKRGTERQMVKEFATKNGFKAATRAGVPRGQRAAYDRYARDRMREMTGQVPAKTTYADFLKRQARDFQDEFLGPERAELFRQGKVALDKFTDPSGRTLTLKELRAKYDTPDRGGSAPNVAPKAAADFKPATTDADGYVDLDEFKSLKFGPATEAQAAALGRYVRDGTRINSALREGRNVADVAELDRLFARSAVPSDMRLYRGVSSIRDTFGVDDLSELLGRELSDLAYTSTTAEARRASRFAGRRGALVQVEAAKGTRAVHPASQATQARATEAEVLFDRGARFEVVRVETVTVLGDTYPSIVLRPVSP